MTPQIKQRIEQIRRGEVPEGYKKTKVGIVPAEWTVCNMGEIYSERKEAGNPTLPILTVSIHSGVSNGELDESELGKKIKRIEDKTQYLTARKGDLVFNMMRAWQGSIGVVQADGLVSPAYIVAKPTVKVCSAFMDEYIKLPESINRLRKKSYGVTDFRLRLYWDSFVKVDCCIPTLAEQDKIAEILTAQDRVIELCEKKTEQLKRLKKVFLQKMFPKTSATVPEWRFPGFTDAWEQRKLGDIAKLYQPTTLSSKQCNENAHYPVFGANGIIGRYDKKNHDTDQVCVSCRGANCGAVNYVNAPVWITGNSMVCNIDSNESMNKLFFYFAMSGLNYLPVITGGAQPQITRDKLQQITVFAPHIEEQKTIGRFLSMVEQTITLHQRKCDEEKQKKKALMQLLLTGIVRT